MLLGDSSVYLAIGYDLSSNLMEIYASSAKAVLCDAHDDELELQVNISLNTRHVYNKIDDIDCTNHRLCPFYVAYGWKERDKVKH